MSALPVKALPAEAPPADAWFPGAGTRPPGRGASRGCYRERRRIPAALAVRRGRAGYGTLCQPRSRDAPSAALRLTPRGRVVAAGMLMILAGSLILAGAPWLAAVGAARAAGRARPAGRDVPSQPGGTGRNAGQAVEPGETLWPIARDAGPGTGTRIAVQQMMRLSALSGPRITPGERLRLPSG